MICVLNFNNDLSDKHPLNSGQINNVSFKVVYGENEYNNNYFNNIDTINYEYGYIFRMKSNGAGAAGTLPDPNIYGNAIIILGFSSYYTDPNAYKYGAQFCFTMKGKILSRYKEYSKVANWTNWVEI